MGILRVAASLVRSDQFPVEEDTKKRAVLPAEDDADLALPTLVLVRSEACPADCFIITCRTRYSTCLGLFEIAYSGGISPVAY